MYGGEKNGSDDLNQEGEDYTTAYETVQDQDEEWGEDGAPLNSEIEDDGLDLDGDDEALPWLESSDYADDDSVDTGRLVGFVMLGLLALALLVGGIWFFSNRGPDPELVADGSTIEAPEGDYKRRPNDAGGKEFPGTGDVAPAVGEGETREGRLADGASGSNAAVRPSVDAPSNNDRNADKGSDAADGSAAGTPSAGNTGSAAASGSPSGPGVQVGAYSNKATAEAGWRQLNRQTSALSGVRYRIVEGEADIGKVFRLQATPGDMAAANRLCTALKADGVACQVKP